MIRYRYVNELIPPAPFIRVTLKCPTTGMSVEQVPAQVDTAADRTILPAQIIADMNLVEYGALRFQGFESEILILPIYLVAITLHDLQPLTIKAALGAHEPFMLLGRDILNAHRIVLDGPNLALEIG